MSINKKGRRKIIYKDRLFYWYVEKNADECDDIYLNIISDDKKLIVSYKVGQSNSKANSLIIVKGKEFNGLTNPGNTSIWLRAPKWEDSIITPSLVSKIIDWCYSDKDKSTVVDRKGNIVCLMIVP